MQVKKQAVNKSQFVYENIRKMIISGQLAEDAPWSIRTLASQFNMSMVPVYGAIRRLEQEGILVVRPKSGISVRKLSASEIRDVFVVREGLEIQAVRMLAKNPDKKVLSGLAQKAQIIALLLKGKKFQEVAVADFEWHLLLIRSTDCTILIQIYDQLSTLCMLTFRTWNPSQLEHAQNKSYSIHMKLVDAIRSGNPDKAEKAVRRHLRSQASV